MLHLTVLERAFIAQRTLFTFIEYRFFIVSIFAQNNACHHVFIVEHQERETLFGAYSVERSGKARATDKKQSLIDFI